MNDNSELRDSGLCLSKLLPVEHIINSTLCAYEHGLINFTQFERIMNECILAYKKTLGD